MKITARLLISKGACKDQVALFRQHFPQGGEVTSDKCLSVAQVFHWGWAADNLLTPTQQAEYNRAKAPALAEYDRAKALALAEYDRAVAPAWAEYNRAMASARAEYERAMASARAEYEHIMALAFAQACEATK